MKLNFFNSWKPLGTFAGRQLTYQTAKENGQNVFATYIKDAKTGKIITKGFGIDKETSLKTTVALLKKIGGEAIYQAIETGEPVLAPARQAAPEKEIDWRDGSNHRYRAQKRIVGETKEEKEEVQKPRNFVAKYARMVNKAGPMKDYTRKPKHKKEESE